MLCSHAMLFTVSQCQLFVQASYTQLQKELQHQHCSKQKSAAHYRKLEDAMQKEQFAHWHQRRPDCCNSQPSSETAMTGSSQAARTLFGVPQHASPEDIRWAKQHMLPQHEPECEHTQAKAACNVAVLCMHMWHPHNQTA